MSAYGMAPLHTRFPDLALAETKTMRLVASEPGLPQDEYGFIEYFCTDPDCDCRRVLICVSSKSQPDRIVAVINYGWESEDFYLEKFSFMAPDEAAEAAREVVDASLDPMNSQSEGADALLNYFRKIVGLDPEYVARLARHYDAFRKAASSPG